MDNVKAVARNDEPENDHPTRSFMAYNRWTVKW